MKIKFLVLDYKSLYMVFYILCLLFYQDVFRQNNCIQIGITFYLYFVYCLKDQLPRLNQYSLSIEALARAHYSYINKEILIKLGTLLHLNS